MKKYRFITGLMAILLFILSTFVYAQEGVSSRELLKKQPNFLTTHLKASDTLFLKDIAVLKNFIVMDSVDVEILKPQILYTLLNENTIDTTATYKTLIDAILTFKQGIGYLEFRKGIILYKQMAIVKVNPKNWENDQILFKRLGFTEADLEDFLLFISKQENKDLNYKEAYLAYMKEIDRLQ
ncbi:hypothetical protein [Pedobacter sp. ASV28]|uniref:hypothetical protein n=1 Tax=Pedobacter sp. ASV28 TaxID=2795123 RepID=UPI001E3C67C4|nr:hypothetical protein [Pedobacter sp. ASV28]